MSDLMHQLGGKEWREEVGSALENEEWKGKDREEKVG